MKESSRLFLQNFSKPHGEELVRIAENHLLDLTEISNGRFSEETQEAITHEAAKRLRASLDAARNPAASPPAEPVSLQSFWNSLVRDFHTQGHWGFQRVKRSDPPPKKKHKPKNQAASFIISVFMSLAVIKSLVMWTGAWYADYPSNENLFYLLGSIALSVISLVWTGVRYARAKAADRAAVNETDSNLKF